MSNAEKLRLRNRIKIEESMARIALMFFWMIKARRAFNPLAWIKQSVAAADGRLPLVIIRCDGQGEATIDEWPVMLRLADAIKLLHEAGYGTGEPQ